MFNSVGPGPGRTSNVELVPAAREVIASCVTETIRSVQYGSPLVPRGEFLPELWVVHATAQPLAQLLAALQTTIWVRPDGTVESAF